MFSSKFSLKSIPIKILQDLFLFFFRIKTIDVSGVSAKLHIWDTAGQDRFKNIVSSFYRGADGVVLVFDVTNMDSFQNIGTWMKDARHYASDQCTLLLVGNKSDLVKERVVSFEAAQSFADSVGLPYLETSAKSSFNVHKAVNNLAETLVKERKESSVLTPATPVGFIDIRARQVHTGWCFGKDTCSTL
uniref:SOCS box domain-containing protein n=1 Tax=Biomphalaria glabrata TaxID=6526 RepID=A0A2C9LZP0_BIOGL